MASALRTGARAMARDYTPSLGLMNHLSTSWQPSTRFQAFSWLRWANKVGQVAGVSHSRGATTLKRPPGSSKTQIDEKATVKVAHGGAESKGLAPRACAAARLGAHLPPSAPPTRPLAHPPPPRAPRAPRSRQGARRLAH